MPQLLLCLHELCFEFFFVRIGARFRIVQQLPFLLHLRRMGLSVFVHSPALPHRLLVIQLHLGRQAEQSLRFRVLVPLTRLDSTPPSIDSLCDVFRSDVELTLLCGQRCRFCKDRLFHSVHCQLLGGHALSECAPLGVLLLFARNQFGLDALE